MRDKHLSDQQHYPGSVLLSDRIEALVKENMLIVENTFDEQRLRTAKYDFRLGTSYFKGGNLGTLNDDSNPVITIEPYELIFVESFEIFHLPKNVIGRYDLRISGCLAGVGLQTGLQLDPTYYGRIFSPLFNFSDTRMLLKFKDHLASIEFIYTTPPTSKTKAFESPRQRFLHLHEALPLVPRSTGVEMVWARLSAFGEEATRLHMRIDTMVAAVYTAMAFMIAVLAVIAAALSAVLTSDIIPQPFPLGIGLIVLFVIAAIALVIIRKTIRGISKGDGTSRQTK
jgi:deoxycytidine triphosphate deaminase